VAAPAAARRRTVELGIEVSSRGSVTRV